MVRVSIMVTLMILFVSLFAPSSIAGIQQVIVESEKVIRTKPCLPVYVTLRVELDADIQTSKLRRSLPAALGRNVIINGAEYPSEFAQSPVIIFGLDSLSIPSGDESVRVFGVFGILFWNRRDEKILFDTPDKYDIQLHDGARIQVVVEEPTSAEALIVDELRKKGKEALELIGEPGANDAEFVSWVEQQLENHPSTAYTRLFTTYVGLGKLNALPIDYSKDHRDYFANRVTVCKEYFPSLLEGDFHYPVEVLASVLYGELLLKQVEVDPSNVQPSAREARQHAIALLEKVVQSRVPSGEREKARRLLAKAKEKSESANPTEDVEP